jgi:hypothetical protein
LHFHSTTNKSSSFGVDLGHLQSSNCAHLIPHLDPNPNLCKKLLRNRKQVEGGVRAERGKNFPSVQLGGCLIFRPTLEEGYYCWFIEALAHWWFLCVLWVYFYL